MSILYEKKSLNQPTLPLWLLGYGKLSMPQHQAATGAPVSVVTFINIKQIVLSSYSLLIPKFHLL